MAEQEANTNLPPRTRWLLLMVVAAIVLIPSAIVAAKLSAEPVDPPWTQRALALDADANQTDLGTLGGDGV